MKTLKSIFGKEHDREGTLNMAPVMNSQKARMMALMLSGAYVFVHFLLFCFFFYFNVTPMIYFNIFSVALYISLFAIALKKGLTYWFAMAVYLEVGIHMAAATYFTGWDSGFQIAMIAMCVLTAYAEYVGRTLKTKSLEVVPLGLIVMVVYLALCWHTRNHPAPYPLPEEVCFLLQMFWGFTVFVIVIIFLAAFVRITIGSEEYLEKQAGHDRLTGLPNRFFIMNHFEALREDDDLQGHWLSIIDIDDFKKFNDTHGHNCGDAILVQLAELILEGTGEYTACRWGGEEFILVGRIRGDSDDCRKRIEDLRLRVMNHSFTYQDIVLRLTITVGYEEYAEGMTVEEWINGADRKLYAGKRNGKNQVV